MKNISTVWILMFLFLGLSIYLFFVSKKNINRYDKLRVDLIVVENNIEVLTSRMQKEINSDHQILDDIQLADIYGNTIPISQLVRSPKLVYRLCETSCAQCTKNDTTRLKNMATVIGAENIIIISDYLNIRNLRLMNNQLNNIQIFNYRDSFNISMDSNSIDRKNNYFFLLDKDLLIKFPFISDEDPETADVYLNRIKDYFIANQVILNNNKLQ